MWIIGTPTILTDIGKRTEIIEKKDKVSMNKIRSRSRTYKKSRVAQNRVMKIKMAQNRVIKIKMA